MRDIAQTRNVSEEEQTSIRSMLGALQHFRALRSTMPLQYVTAFLLVAEKEGLGVIDYARRAGVSVSVMSRHLLDIGKRNRKMKPGFGLVTYRSNPNELRRHEYFLTDKGRALLHQIRRSLAT